MEKKELDGTTQNKKVQLTLSDKLKELLEKRAEELGIPLTQYIMSLIIEDLKKPIKA